MYVSAADNDYVGVTGTFLGTASQQRRCLRDSELAGKEAVYLCDGVVAEQRGCDARGRCRVRGDLSPVGQQRARDGGLRLRVLRACRAAVSQQRCAEV